MPGPDPSEFFTRTPTVRTVETRTRDAAAAPVTVPVYDFLDGREHYSASFGKQWTKYRDVQIDRLNGTRLTYNHLRWFVQDDLSVFKDAACLEIGSGAGRFTDYLVDLCKTVITVDPSPAITVNAALAAPNLIAARADLFDVPVRRETIDVVFCRGVTQHTVDPRRAIQQLFRYVRPGGVVLFDVYHFKWFTPLVVKYWLRPFTRRVPHDAFVGWAERWVPRLLKFKSRVVNRLLPANKLGVNIGAQLVPIADFSTVPELGSWERQVQWSVLDTVDMYTPRYDKPMTYKAILNTLAAVGARDVRGNRSSFCFRAVAP